MVRSQRQTSRGCLALVVLGIALVVLAIAAARGLLDFPDRQHGPKGPVHPAPTHAPRSASTR